MDLQSSDGTLEVEGVDGALKAHASDGHLKIAGRFDSLQLSSSDGRIEAHASRQIHHRVRVGTFIPETGASPCSCRKPLPPMWTCIPATGTSALDMPVSVEGQLGHNNIHGKLNGGGNLLTIHTGDGSIRLEKS